MSINLGHKCSALPGALSVLAIALGREDDYPFAYSYVEVDFNSFFDTSWFCSNRLSSGKFFETTSNFF